MIKNYVNLPYDLLPLKELCIRPLRSGVFKPTYQRGKGMKMINMNEIFEYNIIHSGFPMELVNLTKKEKENSLLENYSLLFARSSLIFEGAGKCSILVNKNEDEFTYESHIISAIINKEEYDPKFYYYYFTSKYGKNQIETIVEQTGAAGIRKSDLENLNVPCPPYIKQKGIAEILWEIDTQIERLEKINDLLIMMGNIIFKSWFIDFEKNHELVASELGFIPKGWKVKKLDEYVDVVKGRSYSSEDLVRSKNVLVSLKCFKANGEFNEEGLKQYAGKYNKEQIVIPGDIVIAITDITQNGDVLGKPILVMRSKFDTMIASLDLLIVRTKGKIPRSFLYFLLKDEEFQAHARGYATGTNVLHLDKNVINDHKFILPESKMLEEFDSLADELITCMLNNFSQIQNLGNFKHHLSLNLISGEVNIGN